MMSRADFNEKLKLTCTYDSKNKVEATKFCFICHAPLCNFCGFTDQKRHSFCNTCWQEREENGVCSRCGEELEPVYENTGYAEPQTHWEIIGYKSCECRRN